MRLGRLIGFAFAVIFMLTGLLFLWASTSPQNTNTTTTVLTGLFFTGIGIAILVLTLKFLPTVKIEKTVVQKIDLAGDTELEQMKCKSCGAPLPSEAIKVAGDGSVVISCPYCSASYQITEQPKW